MYVVYLLYLLISINQFIDFNIVKIKEKVIYLKLI